MHIPKVIHWIWLSEDSHPPEICQCLSSWQELMPDYSIRRWRLSDLHAFEPFPHFLQRAIAEKHWAFASDFLRIAILKRHGGVYLDSDVMLLKNLSPKLLGGALVTAIEYHPPIVESQKTEASLLNGIRLDQNFMVPGIGIQAAFIASVPNHPFLDKCENYYRDLSISNVETIFSEQAPIAPTIFGILMEEFGFRWMNEEQRLSDEMLVHSSSVVSSHSEYAGPQSCAIHCCSGSWRNRKQSRRFKFVPSSIKARLLGLFDLK